MTSASLSLTARTLYAELRELALAVGATENIGDTPGAVVSKTVRGSIYFYYQYRDLDGRTKQAYLGADRAIVREVASRLHARSSEREGDREQLHELRAAFLAAGGGVTEHAPLRVIKGFADAGLLQPGPGSAVLVGTHAFNALGNLLGVRWVRRMQTHDIDLAAAPSIHFAVTPRQSSAPDVLGRLNMGFIPVPSLNTRSPSTSYRIRGRELRVDLLSPMTGKLAKTPVFVPSLNAHAQPVRFLDYLIDDTISVPIVGRRLLVLVNVPLPERFALHKLLVSESRPSAFATKAEKDRVQGAQLLEVLLEEAPDGIGPAKKTLEKRGQGWCDRLARAIEKSRNLSPAAFEYLAEL